MEDSLIAARRAWDLTDPWTLFCLNRESYRRGSLTAVEKELTRHYNPMTTSACLRHDWKAGAIPSTKGIGSAAGGKWLASRYWQESVDARGTGDSATLHCSGARPPMFSDGNYFEIYSQITKMLPAGGQKP